MTDYAITGQCNVTITLSATLARSSAIGINGFIATRVIPLANLSKPVIVPVNWVSRQYECVLTGSPDLVIPVSSFSANLSVSGSSSLNLTVAADGDLLDEIIDRSSGDLILSRVYLYSDGSTVARPFITVNFNNLSSNTNPANTTLTLQGTKTLKALASKAVQLDDAMYRNFIEGLLRYRCAVNDELALGDTAVINGEQLIVGRISYSVSPVLEFMEISEYQADGDDMGSAIGSNARPLTLSEYSVTTENDNYDLWMLTAFYYNGITASGQTIGQAYTLYNDSDGYLWYMAGFEGASNIPVYLVDGTTQANINV